jgi:Fic family protein
MRPREPKFTITNAIAADLTAIERARGFLDAATLSEDWVRRMSQRALLLEAHHTTHIEGTQLTVVQAEALWAGKEVDLARVDDTRELLNYRDAFNLVSCHLNSGAPTTEELIREIHKRLVTGVRGGRGRPGVYRIGQNYVANSKTGEIIYTPPPAGEVPNLMAALVAWLEAEKEIHPVLIAGLAQFELVHIHPFVDGNGRTSRLLSTLCLYRAGYDFKRLFTLSEFYDRDRAAFYRAIQSVRERDMDRTTWLEYFVRGLATQLSEVKARGERAIRLDLAANERGLNERQRSILGQVATHGHIRISECESLFPHSNRRTLQRDLASLEAKGFIVATGATNNRVYVLPQNS